MTVRFVADPVGLAELIRSPNGDTARYMIRLGTRVRDRARDLVGVSRGGIDAGRNPGPHLRDSLVTRFEVDGRSMKVRVGSELPYALYHHEGTRPHLIPGNPLLVFFWGRGPAGPKVYYFRKVNHPGTRPNRYLTDAMEDVIRRGGEF